MLEIIVFVYKPKGAQRARKIIFKIRSVISNVILQKLCKLIVKDDSCELFRSSEVKGARVYLLPCCRALSLVECLPQGNTFHDLRYLRPEVAGRWLPRCRKEKGDVIVLCVSGCCVC